MSFRIVLALFLLLGGQVSLMALDSVPEYHVTRLGPLIAEVIPGTGLSVSRALAINENGDAAGDVWASVGALPWVYTVEHGVVALPLLPGFSSAWAVDLSDRDASGEIVIVGAALSGISSTVGAAVLWRFSTALGLVLETRDIGVLPGMSDAAAVAVNNSGIVIGYSDGGPLVGREPMKYDIATNTLESLTFPAFAVPSDLNNLGQITGGRYLADLFGNVQDLGLPPDCTSVSLSCISDTGLVAGRAGRPFTDGAGHFMVSIVRYLNPGWHVMPPFSHLDSGNDINVHGDVVGEIGVSAAIRGVLYIAALDELHLLENLLAPHFDGQVFPNYAFAINDHGQVGAYAGDAIVLTPLGETIIPGDVNGDASVDLDDLCAWLVAPIDLDGNGVVDAADESWLTNRLAVFGFVVADCNANGVGDHCDIVFATSLDCDENDVPDECQADCNADGTPDSCEADCNGNGTPDPCDIAAGTSEDCNGNGIPDECDQGGVFTLSNVFATPVQLLADETFTDSALSTEVGTIEDVDFTLDLDYRIGNLTVDLTHAGTTVTLIDRPGFPGGSSLGNGQLGYDIVLDDEGTGPIIEDVGNFGSPFDPVVSPPSYRPNNPLGIFDGLATDGLWTVTVTTTDTYSPLSSFRSWGLVVTRAAVPVGPCGCLGGDVNGDETVNVADAIVMLAYLFAGGPAPDPLAAADVNGDGSLDVSDPVYILGFLFMNGPPPEPCS